MKGGRMKLKDEKSEGVTHLKCPATGCVHRARNIREGTALPPLYRLACGAGHAVSNITYEWEVTDDPVTCKRCKKLEER